jgi:hypothetical protein
MDAVALPAWVIANIAKRDAVRATTSFVRNRREFVIIYEL